MGELARTLLSEQIRSIVDARQSGVLALSQQQVTKGIFFRGGQIVFASSTLESDKLGESLIRLGRISRSEFAAAYQATRNSRSRLGQALVGAGIVTEEELGRLVAHQVRKIVMSLFTWTQGETGFEEAPDPIPADLALDLSTHRLLLEGVRIYPDAKRLEHTLGPPQRRLRLAPRPPFDYRRMSLSPVEREIIHDARAELRISDMMANPSARDLIVRAIYGLLVSGILEEVDQPPRIEPLPREEHTATFKLAIAEAQRCDADRKQQILRLYEAMPRSTHYEVLGLPWDSDPTSIAETFHALEKEMEEHWQALKGDVQLSSLISTLRFRQREAYRVLVTPELRNDYDRTLGALQPRLRDVTPAARRQAEKLAERARALLEKGDRDGAVPLLLEAVDCEPEDASVRRILAIALSDHPTLFRTAERHFLTALELTPEDLDLRYRLALYYRRAGMPKRALIQLRAVLDADPEHEGARVELRTLQAENRFSE